MIEATQTVLQLTDKDKARFWAKVDNNGPTMSHMDTPCWVWTAGKFAAGYGAFQMGGKVQKSHRIAWALSNSAALGPCICHHCDNPSCVNPSHLFLGTHIDNMRDMVIKGRQAKNERHGSKLHPDRVARGDRHGSRTHPEVIIRGDSHWTRTNPERLARGENNGAYTKPERRPKGDRHGSQTKPDRVARGDRNGSRTKPASRPRGDNHPNRLRPERMARGEANASAKLTAEKVAIIRQDYSSGIATKKQLALRFGVSNVLIGFIIKRKIWRHVHTITTGPQCDT